MLVNVTQLPHFFWSTPKEILQKPAGRAPDPVRIGRLHIIPARAGRLTRQTEPEFEL
jgi:hypothetical protein